MRRILLCLALVGLALGLSPARADFVTSASVGRAAHLVFDHYDSATQTNTGGDVYVILIVKAVSTDTSATPTVDALAGGYTYTCDNINGCQFTSFNQQTVSPTALTMDPIGNSAQINACLFPTSGPCRNFNLTFSRPSSLSPAICVPLIVCVGLNAWLDPVTNEAEIAVYESTGIYRYGYKVTGTWNGAPLPTLTPSNSWVDSGTGTTLSASQVVGLP